MEKILRPSLQPLTGCTHIAIIGTYNKLWVIVKYGDQMEERMTDAIASFWNAAEAGPYKFAGVDLFKKEVIVKYDNSTSKIPITFRHLREF
jgi:hypothetical protein